MSQYPDGLIPFGPDANCTLELCPVEWSVFQYQPSIAANATFIAIFGLLMAIHVVQGAWYKTWGYMACMVSGCVLEIVGYVGRIMLHSNPFDFEAFLIQIICITVAPVFYCAAIYVLLSKFIIVTDVSVSRFNPKLFYWLFIPADITCLILQATGGALSATGSTEDDVNVGVDISKAGLILQVVVLGLFLVMTADYLFSLRRKTPIKLSRPMLIFLSFMISAVILILVRCIYRIVELADGYFGPNFRHEPEFIGLEGAVMCVAVVCLVIGHPGPAFRRSDESRSGKEFTSDEEANESILL